MEFALCTKFRTFFEAFKIIGTTFLCTSFKSNLQIDLFIEKKHQCSASGISLKLFLSFYRMSDALFDIQALAGFINYRKYALYVPHRNEVQKPLR